MADEKLKHYEDIGRNSLNQQTWIDAYSSYLKETKNQKNNSTGTKLRSCYIDIDSVNTYGVKVPEFYRDFTDFLNEQNKKILNRDVKLFKEPEKKTKRPGNLTIHTSNEIKNTLGEMYLTSDTFAFSEPKILSSGEWKTTHPLGAYLELCPDNTEMIAQYIYDTRTIGGVFIWPKVNICGNWISCYNNKRGVKVRNLGSYINDRVDLTLQEIKMFYQFSKGKSDDIETIKEMNKKGYILLKGKDSECICRWLKYFKSFEKYVDFFCFKGNFVNNDYNPINIITEQPIVQNDPMVNAEFFMDEYQKMLVCKNKIEKMLKFISQKIISRSIIIENI